MTYFVWKPRSERRLWPRTTLATDPTLPTKMQTETDWDCQGQCAIQQGLFSQISKITQSWCYSQRDIRISPFTGFPVRSEIRETFPRTETIRSHSSRTGNPIQSQSSVQRDDFRFCWTVRNSSLFLAHPTYRNKCTTSEYAQCSSRSGFWIFKISRKVRVLKQSQSALLSSISHMTIFCTHKYDE